MQKQNKQHLLGWVQGGLRRVRSGTGDISQAAESSAGRASVPTNAPGEADAGSDIGGSEGPIA